MDIGPTRKRLDKMNKELIPLLVDRINQSPYLSLKEYTNTGIYVSTKFTPHKGWEIKSIFSISTDCLIFDVFQLESDRWNRLIDHSFLIRGLQFQAYKLGAPREKLSQFPIKEFPNKWTGKRLDPHPIYPP